MSFVYTNTVPNPPNLPSTDVNAMQTNTATIDSWVQQDHFGFNNADGGHHQFVAMKNQVVPGTPPAIPAGMTGVLYTDVNTGNSWPFWKNTALNFFQLTGSASPTLSPSAGTNGWSFLPGGMIIQWGRVNIGPLAGVVLFTTANIDFPNNCFVVTGQVITNGGAPFGTMSTFGLSNTSFSYGIQNQGAINAFSWVAIGN